MPGMKSIFNFIIKFLGTVVVIILIIGLGTLTAFLLFEHIYYVGETIVPEVVGDSLSVAQQKLYKANLKISISAEEFDDQIPQNHILKQDPAAGTKLKQRREIKVVVSKGEKRVTINIPDVRNKNLEEAINIIKESGLTVGKVAYVSHFSIPKNKVISQTPEPGRAILEDNTINLLVSLGNY